MASTTDTETNIDINELFDKMLLELNPLNPKWCRKIDDDTRIDNYISISPHNYMILSGCCDECDFVGIYKHGDVTYDIKTQQGIEDYVNCNDGTTEPGNIIFELELDDDEFNESMNDLILLLTKLVKGIVSF
jgi:hypothetical protein